MANRTMIKISHFSNHDFKKVEIKLISSKFSIQAVIKELAKCFNKLRFEAEQKIEKFKTSLSQAPMEAKQLIISTNP